MSRALVALAATLTVGSMLVATPATAGTTTSAVTISGHAFNPTPLRTELGATVTWTNTETMQHTATSDQGFFDTGPIDTSGGTKSVPFTSAGRFYYHCSFHSDMHGRIVVPMVVVSGSATEGWKLRWATAKAPEGLAFDVQYKKLSADHYTNWRKDTAAASGKLDPTKSGNYAVRARTTTTGADPQRSAWSPAVQLTIS